MYNYKELEKEVLEIIKQPLVDDIFYSNKTTHEAYLDAITDLAQEKEIISANRYEFLSGSMVGFFMNQFTILCGSTGSGKTTFLANMACDFQAQEIPFFVASVEIGHADFVKKMFSVLSGSPFDSGEHAPKEKLDRFKNEHGSFFHNEVGTFTNYDSRIPHMRLLCDLLWSYKFKGTKIALVDNLNFMMEVTSEKNQVMEMDRVVHDFVVFCKKVPIHVVMVMHPKKTENGRVESEFDIKGSSTAVQEASNVFLWNRLKKPEDSLGEAPDYCRELKIVKARKKGRAVGTRIVYTIRGDSEQLREHRIL